MELNLETYDCLCELSVFTINGKKATYKDFGNKEYIESQDAPDYCCKNMTFISKPPTQDVLDKYNITVEEYNEICKKLDCLSFGECGWCE